MAVDSAYPVSIAATQYAVSMRSELDEALPPFTGDRVQLQQVLLTLMLNGIEAMSQTRGKLTDRQRDVPALGLLPGP